MKNQHRPDHVQLTTEGEACLQEMVSILETWPAHCEYGRRMDFRIRSAADKQRINKALQRFKQWIEELARQRALHDRLAFEALTQIVQFALTDELDNENALDDAKTVKSELLQLVESMPVVNRLPNGLCPCEGRSKAVSRQVHRRAQPRLYRRSNPLALRKG